ncbi:hypothetical protein IVA88_17015 [Bradyrhizobium sp. 149]|nr:hypothetical protein [Bradyrhizobium sp. 149]
MMVNTVWAIGFIFVVIFLGLTGEYAVVVICGFSVVNGVMSFLFLRQRLRMRD